MAEVMPSAGWSHSLINFQHLARTIGMLMGYSANHMIRINWSSHTQTAALPALSRIPTFSYQTNYFTDHRLVLLSLIFMLPESPMWLVKKGQHAKALQALCHLRGAPILGARDLVSMYAQIQAERQTFQDKAKRDLGLATISSPTWSSNTSRLHSLWTLFNIRRTEVARRARWAAAVTVLVMISQQMKGISLLALFASKFLSTADSEDHMSNISGQAAQTDSPLSLLFMAGHVAYSTALWCQEENKARSKSQNGNDRDHIRGNQDGALAPVYSRPKHEYRSQSLSKWVAKRRREGKSQSQRGSRASQRDS